MDDDDTIVKAAEADARSDLADARSDLAAADKRLADAEAQEERDEGYIKECRVYVKKCQQHVTTMQKLLEEAASKVCPCKFILKLFCTLFTCNFQFPAAKKLKIERLDPAYIGMLDF